MPNIKSAIKRVKVSNRKTLANKSKKSEIRSEIKKAKASIAASPANSAEAVQAIQVALDKAATKGFIHKNAAARKKSRIARAAAKAANA